MKLALASLTAVLLSAAPLAAEETGSSDAQKAREEMNAALGPVPSWVQALPEHRQGAAWELMKAQGNPDAPIPPKYRELIEPAVAAQIPCQYCVYAHTQRAQRLGASEAEIGDALGASAYARYFSTLLNGTQPTMEDFKAQFEGMAAHAAQRKVAAEKSR